MLLKNMNEITEFASSALSLSDCFCKMSVAI